MKPKFKLPYENIVEEVYNAYVDAIYKGEYSTNVISRGFMKSSLKNDVAVFSDFFHFLRERFTGVTVKKFHEMILDMYNNAMNWNGFVVCLQRGTITGVMTRLKRQRRLLFHGLKFIKMVKLEED